MDYNNNQPVSIGDWMVTYLLMCIPLVNFILLLVWAFSGGTNPSKANWAKANLIWMLIVIAIYVLIIVIFGAAAFAGLESLNY